MKKALLGLLSLFLGGCVALPDGVTPVVDFEVERYLGTWYEIARLDHSFERGLERVTAHYSLREDGGITVVNRGYSTEKERWQEVEGRAYFVESDTQGYLKVSFFGPFYGSYIVFDLDRQDYRYAFVSGPNKSYLWLLARSPTVSDAVRARFEKKAEELGYDTSQLIYVQH